ncbi:MAG: hypothetical protein WD824_21650 [Cyclobacteriaceae bacterium]
MQNVKSKPAQRKTVEHVPEGMHTVTPFLIVDGAGKSIEFIKNAFNGEQTFNWKEDDGKVWDF